MKSVLITGSAGFLGTHLCEYFLKNDYFVIGIDNYCTGQKLNTATLADNWGNKFQFIEADISKEWHFTKIIAPLKLQCLQYIFHFASPASPFHYQRLAIETLWANTKGLESALFCADQYDARVIFASSSEIYGDASISPQPEAYWGNVNSFGERSCYDEAKRFGESLIYSHNKRNGSKHGLIRIFNTYGPGMNPNDGRVVINLLLQALKNEPLTVYGDGNQTRSFCYVDDLIAGIAAYAFSSICEPLNLGNDIEYSINHLSSLILKETGSSSKINFKGLPSDDPTHRRPDLSRSKLKLSNWQPKYSLEEGLRKMIESYR